MNWTALLAASLGAILTLGVLGLLLRRNADRRASAAAWMRLARVPSALPTHYATELTAGLPEPARRYFDFVIRPGARLTGVVELEMGGELGLGTREAPGYRPMRARQILSPPHGLVWLVETGSGLARVAGSDGIEGERSWVRFWLDGLVPVVRAGGNPDHLRAAFGRVVAEAAFWAPAALLPGHGISWQALDGNTARATVVHRGITQQVDIHVDADGRPLWVSIDRWTDANPERRFRLQPFGGYLSEFREVGGYRLPTRVDGGNFFGTDAYFPFFRARVERIRLLTSTGEPFEEWSG